MVTFRSGIKTAVADLLADADMTCAQTEEALIALVVALADLREEGAQLFPRLVICDDLEEFLKVVQGTSPLTLGTGPRVPSTIARGLKKCAPLADEGWAIWVSRGEQNFTYGVFRRPASPTSLDLRSTLLDMPAEPSLHALTIAQFAPGRVEVVAAGQPVLRIHMSGERADLDSPEGQSALVKRWSHDITDDRLRSSFASFAARLLLDLLRKGHGALIAVVEAGVNPHNFVEDAVILDEPVDLAALVEEHAESGSSEALSELLDYSGLLAGMLGSDGIVLLDSVGRVLAFNWFVKTDLASLSARDQQGGARHRAFGALSALTREGTLRGVFIRSSDGGESAFEGSPS